MKVNCQDCGAELDRMFENRISKCEKCKRKSTDSKRERARSHSIRLRKYKDLVAIMYMKKCAICGWRITDGFLSGRNGMDQYGNEIHHVIKINDGGGDEFSNLIMLCPNHHKQADRGFITIEEIRKYQISEDSIELNYDKNREALSLERLNFKDASDFL